MASTTYIRTCVKCGDVATVTYKPKPGSKCLACAAGENAYAMSQARIGQTTRYTRVCIHCGDVKTDCRAKPREPQRCAACSRKYSKGKGKPKKDKLPKIPKLRYFRLCQECGDTKQVGSVKASQAKLCSKCSKKLAVRGKGKKPPKPRKVSKEAIERAKQLNKAHREKEAKEPKVIRQTKTEEQMMAEWLSSNEIKTIVPSKLAAEEYRW